MVVQDVRRVTMPGQVDPPFKRRELENAVTLCSEHGACTATLTLGASTVGLSGPQRLFAEPTAADPVSHAVWVRTLPAPFDGSIDPAWLEDAFAANRSGVPDVLALAMQYTHGAPAIHDGVLQIAGEAGYGPLRGGKRQEGSDFNDYLGVTWTYPDDRVDAPEPGQFRCLDCSGFMRMIWGYRHNLAGFGYVDNIALCLDASEDRSAMPRRANEIYASGPGVVVIEDEDAPVVDLSPLAVGDLLFFNADAADGARLDHVGMYLGIDDGGHHRFISSRKGHNGPTLGDVRGRSILNGTGLYAKTFRAARRL